LYINVPLFSRKIYVAITSGSYRFPDQTKGPTGPNGQTTKEELKANKAHPTTAAVGPPKRGLAGVAGVVR
jgi:hypothetical protein